MASVHQKHPCPKVAVEKLNGSGAFNKPIVTEISPLKEFYKAEDYHQQYFNLHGDAPYCQFVIVPKLNKFKEVFRERVKK